VIAELEKDLPKIIGPPRSERPHLVFTDGACEDDGTSIGGVLYCPDGTVECFGCVVPVAIAEGWKSRAEQLQVIGQAEIFPVLVARWTWEKYLKGKRVIYLIDNESARLSLVKCYSPVLASLRLVLDCMEFDQSMASHPWYARVPTHSNIADDPSRMSVPKAFMKAGGVVVPPIFNTRWLKRENYKLGDLRTLI
jgi:hypothetical protein